MKTYLLYGTSELTAAQLRDAIERSLGLEFQEQDSSYLGGVYYRSGDLRDEHLVILSNEAEDPDDLPDPDFADKRVLLEVNATLRPAPLRERLAAISGLLLLRSREL